MEDMILTIFVLCDELLKALNLKEDPQLDSAKFFRRIPRIPLKVQKPKGAEVGQKNTPAALDHRNVLYW